MLPVQRFTHFIDAHSAFFKAIAENPKMNHSDKPIDASEVNASYVIYQDGYNTIQCQYEIDDRHYTRTEVLRFIKRQQRRELKRLSRMFKDLEKTLDIPSKA